MKLQSIVVGTDFSTVSKPAVDQALALAVHDAAELVLVHGSGLAEPPPIIYSESVAAMAPWAEYITERMRVAEEKLAEVREECARAGVKASSRLSHSHPDVELTTIAREVHADLIVVGTHGRQGTERWLLGSVAESILRLSSRHVLVARDLTPPRGRFERVLCAVDFSPTSDRGIDLALALSSPDASIELVHGWEPPLFYGLPPPSELSERVRARALEHGQRLVARYAEGGRRVRFQLVDAPPVEAVLRHAGASDREIVVIGSHGRRGVRRLVLGSVAEAIVRRSPLSVLVAHGDPER